jgi:hypothetical protein
MRSSLLWVFMFMIALLQTNVAFADSKEKVTEIPDENVHLYAEEIEGSRQSKQN